MRFILVSMALYSFGVSALPISLEATCMKSLKQRYSGNPDLKVETIEVGPQSNNFAIIRFSLRHTPSQNLQCNEAVVSNDASCTIWSIADTMMCE